MKLIVGLGNPGQKYNLTRHNLGFLALDFYAKVKGLEWEKKEKFGAVWLKEGKNLLIKPQNFYNDSGRAVQEFKHYYKIENQNILVVQDDFSLEFGKIRYREKGSAGGNNGIKSIIEQIGEEFGRLKVGTENKKLREQMGDTDFVLGRFTEEERKMLPEILTGIRERIEN